MSLCLAICLCLLAVASSSDASFAAGIQHRGTCENHVANAAQLFGIPVGVLYAVGLTESGLNGGLHPFAMNIEGQARFPDSRREALRILAEARRNGIVLIDIGCMQINHHYHRDQFPDDAAMFDPKRNVMYAARFLKSLKKKHKTWSMAVARYHAGPHNDAAQRRYVCRVIGNLVAVGAGRWTPAARAFCEA